MSDSTTINAASPSRRPSTMAAIVGGTVLVASLGAGAGWLMRGEVPAQPPAAALAQTPVSSTLPAPGTSSQPMPDDEVAPPAKAAPVRQEERAPTPKPVAAAKPAPKPVAKAVCQTCGTVESITEVKQKGDANGIGAVGGAVVGAALGNQVGGGNGRKAMTVLGAVGGGFAGHEIEKQVRADTRYQVRVRMDNGATRTMTVKDAPAPGARVVIEGESLRVNS